MTDEDKVPLDVSEHENLQAALLKSTTQIAGGKRHDLPPWAAEGSRHLLRLPRYRRHHRAQLRHGPDALITDPSLDVKTFAGLIDRFAEEVRNRLSSVGA